MDIRKRANLWRTIICGMSVVFLQLSSPLVHADGDDTLGPPPPTFTISAGTGIVAAGVGLSETQPGTINIDVPAGATVNQVLLYWEGRHNSVGDDVITVDGTPVMGESIGDVVFSSGSVFSTAYRADITPMGAVVAGTNSLEIGGMNFPRANNGAGVIVIYDVAISDPAVIDLRDGNDFAYAPQSRTTDAQTYTFAASEEDRVATLMLFFSSVSGTASSGEDEIFRPTVIEVTLGGGTKTVFNNELDSNDGQEWDTVIISVPVPAGETSVTVQALSEDSGEPVPKGKKGTVASFHWIASGLAITPDLVPGRMTGGGKQVRVDNARITRGFTIHCDIRLSNNIEVNWKNNRWHLDKPITSAVCTDDPAIGEEPPKAGFDTFEGEGTGRLNGVDGSFLRFVFVDAGEPGRNDSASIQVWAPGADPGSDTPVLDVSGPLDHGNIQAHYDQPHKKK